jgi:hypothetical protein
MDGRRCEGCGVTMPSRMHRQARPSDGLMVCPHCLGLEATATIDPGRYRMTDQEQREHLRVGHGWSDTEIDSHHPSDLGPLHVGLHEASAMYDWMASPSHDHHGLAGAEGSLRALAHESSDDLECPHCPWCGSGQTTANPDGTITCGFGSCGRTYTVRLQPTFPAMPQTVDGMPYPPGQPGAAPGMPGDEMPGQLPMGETEPPPGGLDGEQEPVEGAPDDGADDDLPAFMKGSALRTAAGAMLPADAYLRHLALVESGYDEGVLDQVRKDASLRIIDSKQSRSYGRHMSASSTSDGHVECSECGHLVEQHDQRGCRSVDGCPCPVHLTAREIGDIRSSHGLPRRFRPSELG